MLGRIGTTGAHWFSPMAGVFRSRALRCAAACFRRVYVMGTPAARLLAQSRLCTGFLSVPDGLSFELGPGSTCQWRFVETTDRLCASQRCAHDTIPGGTPAGSQRTLLSGARAGGFRPVEQQAYVPRSLPAIGGSGSGKSACRGSGRTDRPVAEEGAPAAVDCKASGHVGRSRRAGNRRTGCHQDSPKPSLPPNTCANICAGKRHQCILFGPQWQIGRQDNVSSHRWAVRVHP